MDWTGKMGKTKYNYISYLIAGRILENANQKLYGNDDIYYTYTNATANIYEVIKILKKHTDWDIEVSCLGNTLECGYCVRLIRPKQHGCISHMLLNNYDN